MLLRVNAETLRNSLLKIISVVDKRSPRAILTYSLFKAEDNKITLEASDLEISSKQIINAEINEPGTFCVNPKNLLDILREMPNQEITLQLLDNNILKILCDQIDISLLTCGIEEFPQLNFDSTTEHFTLTGKEALNFINKTSYAMSNDETRIFLNGIYLQEIDSKLRAVATNGYTFALIESDNFSSSNENLTDGIIIPKKGVAELKKIAESNLDKNLNISIDDSFMYITTENNFLSIRLIARDFPPYQTVIPNKTSYTLTVSRENILNAIKRVKVLANEKSNAIKMSLDNGFVTISANHPTLGEASERIDADYNGKELEIGFNARYVMDSLSVFDEDDITIEFNNELSPVIIKSHQLQQFLGIIMPLKL